MPRSGKAKSKDKIQNQKRRKSQIANREFHLLKANRFTKKRTCKGKEKKRNRKHETHPPFQFQRIDRRKLYQLTTRIVSLDSQHLPGMMYPNLSYGGRAIRRVRRRGSKIIRRLGYQRTRATTKKAKQNAASSVSQSSLIHHQPIIDSIVKSRVKKPMD